MSGNENNVYVGPRPFQRGERIYGRGREAADLVNLLLAERIVLLFSPSGGGKTSLIQAALIPAMQEEGFDVLPVIRVSHEAEESVSQNHYLDSVRLSLDKADSAEPADAANGVGSEESLVPTDSPTPGDGEDKDERSRTEEASYDLSTHLHRCIARFENTKEDSTYRPVLMIFDQFEEILTLDPTDLDKKIEFFKDVGRALQNRDWWAIFSIREDYVGSLDPYVSYIPTRFAASYRLDLLRREEAQEAVQLPARQAGVDFQDAAAEELLNDLRMVLVQQSDGSFRPQPGPYVEPVQLQIVCRRLWQARRDPACITPDDVRRLGSVDNALGEYYAENVRHAAQQSTVAERDVRDWFETQLINPLGIRGQVPLGSEQRHGLNGQTLKLLINTYLVRAERRRGATWFELAHDRLIEPVRSDNARWREANMSTLQLQAAIWASRERSDDLLVRDEVLLEGELWAADHPGKLNPVEHEFLDACRTKRTLEEQAQKVRKYRVMAGLAGIAIIVSIVSVSLLVFAFSERSRANIEAVNASEKAKEAVAALGKYRKELERANENELHARIGTALLLEMASRARVRPIQPGISVSNEEQTAGTICCIVQDRQGQRYVLSADHVLAMENPLRGATIVQPATIDGGQSETDKIGELSDWVPKERTPIVRAAGAIAKIDPDVEAVNDVIALGMIQGIADVQLGDIVQAVGRTSPLVKGRVTAIDAEVKIADSQGSGATYVGMIEVQGISREFSKGGDSGAPVLTEDQKLVGMIYGAGSKKTIVMPIRPVLQALNVELVKSQSRAAPGVKSIYNK